MGMMNRMRPPQPSGRAPQAPQQYTGPMQGRQAFGWMPSRPAVAQQMTPGVTSGMPGRQAFGWTPAGQTPQSQPSSGSGPMNARSVWAEAIRQARSGNVDWAKHGQNALEERRAARQAGARANSYSSDMTNAVGPPSRDYRNPFQDIFGGSGPTRPQPNPRR